MFSRKDSWACCSDGTWVAWGRSPSCGRLSWSRWEGCSPWGRTPGSLETVHRMGSACARRWTVSESLHPASAEKAEWNAARLHSETLLLLIYLADEDHHPLLEAEQFIRHPLGLVQQSVGGVIVTIKSSLQIDQGFHPRLHQHQDRVKQPFILHKSYRRRERASRRSNNPMFIDLFLFSLFKEKSLIYWDNFQNFFSSPIGAFITKLWKRLAWSFWLEKHEYINRQSPTFIHQQSLFGVQEPRWVLIHKHQKTIYIIPVCMQLTKDDYVSLTLKVWCTFQDFICSHFNADQGFIIN